MPMPARDLWSKIQRQLHGASQAEQLRVLRQHLDGLHDEWKGPYRQLRDRLRRMAARLEGHEAVRSRGGAHDPFHVQRQGDAQVAVIGAPNAGKSALVAALTGAATVVADYPFATQHPVPGMLPCAGGALQLVDTPALVEGAAASNRPLLHLLSTMDALAVVVDLTGDPVAQVDTVETELAGMDLRPVAGPVGTVLRPKGRDGVRFRGVALTKEDETAARSLLAGAGVEHAEVFAHTAFGLDQLRAQVDGATLLPTVWLATRAEAAPADALQRLAGRCAGGRPLAIAPGDAAGLAAVAGALRAALGLIRITVLERGATDAAGADHLVPLAGDVALVAAKAGWTRTGPRAARVWGPSVERAGQAVSLQHLVADGDRVYLQG